MGLFDVLGRGLETWGGGEIARTAGPDWREQIAEREAVRRRAAAQEGRAVEQEGRAAAGEQLGLQDKLAQSVAEMMEAEQEQGSAGQMDVGGYQANLPVALPPDYRSKLSPGLVERSGQSADTIVERGRGRRMLSRRQLELLKAANTMGRQEAGQRFRSGEREAGQEFRAAESGKRDESALERLAMRLADNAKYRTPASEGPSVTQRAEAAHRETTAQQAAADKDERAALRQLQAGKITQTQYDEQIRTIRDSLPDPFAESASPAGSPRQAPAPGAEVGDDRPTPAPPRSGSASAREVSTPDEVLALPDGATFRLRGRTFKKQGDRYFEVR
jgi:hypothetical protein